VFKVVLEAEAKKDSGSMSILLDLKARTPPDFNLFEI